MCETPFFFRLIWKMNRSLLLMYVIQNVVAIINTFVWILFPGFLLASLVNDYNNQSVGIIVIFIICEFSLNTLRAWLSQLITLHERSYSDKLAVIIYQKLSSLRMEQRATAEIQEQYETAKACQEDGDVQGVISGIFSIGNSVVIIIGSLLILNQLSWFLLIIFVCFSFFHSICRMHFEKSRFKRTLNVTSVGRRLNYFENDLMMCKYAKDIRAFSLIPFISKMQMQHIDKYSNILKEFRNNRVKSYIF